MNRHPEDCNDYTNQGVSQDESPESRGKRVPNKSRKRRSASPAWVPLPFALAFSCAIGLLVALCAIFIAGMIATEVEHRHVVDLPNWPFLLVWALTVCVTLPRIRRSG